MVDGTSLGKKLGASLGTRLGESLDNVGSASLVTGAAVGAADRTPLSCCLPAYMSLAMKLRTDWTRSPLSNRRRTAFSFSLPPGLEAVQLAARRQRKAIDAIGFIVASAIHLGFIQ
jgi:hypothetical protein